MKSLLLTFFVLFSLLANGQDCRDTIHIDRDSVKFVKFIDSLRGELDGMIKSFNSSFRTMHSFNNNNMTTKEAILQLVNKKDINCAHIKCDHFVVTPGKPTSITTRTSILRVGHTDKELKAFLDSLNFDDGSRWNVITGVIYIKNGGWLQKDGSEDWELYQVPPIPKECL